jgi:hypothetical protein
MHLRLMRSPTTETNLDQSRVTRAIEPPAAKVCMREDRQQANAFQPIELLSSSVMAALSPCLSQKVLRAISISLDHKRMGRRLRATPTMSPLGHDCESGGFRNMAFSP